MPRVLTEQCAHGAYRNATKDPVADVGALVRRINASGPLRVRLASFIARIFRGVPPAEIPIEPPASLELVLNFKVAKALGIRFPDALVLRADEIIE